MNAARARAGARRAGAGARPGSASFSSRAASRPGALHGGPLTPFLDLALRFNRGVSFSLLRQDSALGAALLTASRSASSRCWRLAVARAVAADRRRPRAHHRRRARQRRRPRGLRGGGRLPRPARLRPAFLRVQRRRRRDQRRRGVADRRRAVRRRGQALMHCAGTAYCGPWSRYIRRRRGVRCIAPPSKTSCSRCSHVAGLDAAVERRPVRRSRLGHRRLGDRRGRALRHRRHRAAQPDRRSRRRALRERRRHHAEGVSRTPTSNGSRAAGRASPRRRNRAAWGCRIRSISPARRSGTAPRWASRCARC